MNGLSKNERIKLAIEAFHKGQFKSKTACAKAFDVAPKTLMDCLNGTASREEIIANGRKLSDIEDTLSRWILDMYERGLPLQISNVQHLAQLLLAARLKSPNQATIGENWVTWFIKRRPELDSKYTR